MIRWYEIDPALKDAPEPPPGKPWRVTRYRAHWYWGYRIGPVYGANFRAYWQANAVSWFYHHILGWSCNTWVARSKPANVRAKLPDAAQLAWTGRDNDARRSGST